MAVAVDAGPVEVAALAFPVLVVLLLVTDEPVVVVEAAASDGPALAEADTEVEVPVAEPLPDAEKPVDKDGTELTDNPPN